jgi:hypothetical protein
METYGDGDVEEESQFSQIQFLKHENERGVGGEKEEREGEDGRVE